jgi:hypothetical protein
MEKDNTEDFNKGFESAKLKYMNIIDNDANLKAFVEGYKQGYKDGIRAANKYLEKQMQNIPMDEDGGVQPFPWIRFP